MTDFNKEFLNLTQSAGANKRLLLHVCCAPCACGVLERLTTFKVMPFFYNPNIYPQQEYDLRAMQLGKMGLDNAVICSLDPLPFYSQVTAALKEEAEGGARCKMCIRLRLEETAKVAAEQEYDFFCSTLSVSPHKNAAFINQTGMELQEKYKVNYLINDFKKQDGFKRSTVRSKELGLYRQEYCGCEFSKRI